MSKKPTVLMILDGYGLRDEKKGNGIAEANTPVMDKLMAEYPFVKGNASGLAVGLPDGQMGNSEVGHMNMGAGRIIYQELTKITKAIDDGDFFENKALLAACENAKKNGTALHLMGLVSDGGVHSHITHIYGILELAKRQGLDKVYVHCFLDGRDTPPASGKEFIEQLEAKMKEIGIRHRQEISNCCMEILRTMDKFSWRQYKMEMTKRGYKVHIQENGDGKVYGYSIKRGNSLYKSSVLGVGRNLTPSKIENTWAKLHPQERMFEPVKNVSRQTRPADMTSVLQSPTASQHVMKHYDIVTDEYHSYHVEIPEAADNVIRKDCSLKEAHPLAKIEEIQHTALLLFAGYLDAATSMATSSGGGGSDTGGWGRDKDEDELEWARRCARMANSMCKRRRGLHR